ncbi:hypothetical protein ACGHB7_001702 [Salmonella enterica]
MKLIALKPIYFNGVVAMEGYSLETLEQHGRELITKGYANSMKAGKQHSRKLKQPGR